MAEYRPSYIMELSPGVFRYALPKNLNSHAYNYYASALTKNPVEWDDGTYSGISYSKVYGSYEECEDALRSRYGNFGQYDGLTLDMNVPQKELPEVALDLIRCHKKDNPNYQYPVTANAGLKEALGLTNKDVSYVFTSQWGHLEYEYLLDDTKHSPSELFKEYPNIYFYDSRICPYESVWKVEIKYKDNRWISGHDHVISMKDVETGESYLRVDFRDGEYVAGNPRLEAIFSGIYYARESGIAKVPSFCDSSRIDEMFDEYRDIEYRIDPTKSLKEKKEVKVLYFESGQLKSKEYFQAKGYSVYDKDKGTAKKVSPGQGIQNKIREAILSTL